MICTSPKKLSLPLVGNYAALFFACFLCTTLFAEEKQKASKEVDYGTVKDSVYQNNFFGFKLNIPTEWSVQDQNAQKKLTETGSKLIAGDDKNMEAVMKASEQQTLNLVAAFQHPIGTPVPFNPSVICVAERVHDFPGIKRGKDYHFHTKSLLEQSQMKFKFPKEIYTEKAGGTEFDVMYSELTMGNLVVQQKHYAIITKQYALTFIVSFTTPEQEAALQKILNTLSFQ